MYSGSLRGRRALVTGSSRGIGSSIALGLADHGADVVVHARSKIERAERVAAKARERGAKAVAVRADLMDPGSPQHLFDLAERELGGIDILVINASIQYRQDWLQIKPEAFQAQVRVNLQASLELMQLAAPAMVAQRWGRILTIGSVQEVKPHEEMAVYAATKSALSNMVRNLAVQLAPYGVTVNNLAPGVINTDRNSEALAREDYYRVVLERIPARFVGSTDDCVGPALLLCSDAGRYITGVDLRVDGGMHL